MRTERAPSSRHCESRWTPTSRKRPAAPTPACQEATARLNRFADAERVLRRGDGLLRGPRARRVQPVPAGLAGLRPAADGAVGRGGGSLHRDAGRTRHLAGQPDQPAAGCWGRSAGAAARTGRGTCWTRRSRWPRARGSRSGSSRSGRRGPSCDGPRASPGLAAQEVMAVYDWAAGVRRSVDVRVAGHLAAAAAGGGRSSGGPAGAAERPAGAVRAGDGGRLARRGGGVGPAHRPYDAALARLGSPDEATLREALKTLDDLGARATAAAARRRMKELGDPGDPARATRGHAGRPGRADSPRAGGPGAARGGPAQPGDLPAPGHLRADGGPSRLRRTVQDRRLVPDGGGPRGRPDGHRGRQPRHSPGQT